MKDDTLELRCPKCGKFLGEIRGFFRGRHCGFEIIITSLREEGLTTSTRTPTIPATPTS